ncbi:MAG: hypothetical protein ABIR91_03710 [Candidatus Saccharimonadales bacterium]
MKPDTPTELNQLLIKSLNMIRQSDAVQRESRRDQTVHVSNLGHVLSSAYEQLRNASENIEDHLLFQRAILRFYKRNMSFIDNRTPQNLGIELVTELTQAGYLDNDSVNQRIPGAIDQLVQQFYVAYWMLVDDQSVQVARDDAQRWILELLMVKSEHLFHDPMRILAFAHVAQAHFATHIHVQDQIAESEKISTEDYSKLLYIGIHRALLKSDDANIRSALSDLYGVALDDVLAFTAFNQQYDTLSQSKTATKLARIVSRNGAPLRMIRATFFEHDDVIDGMTLQKSAKVQSLLAVQIDEEYAAVKKRLNAGVVKSIIFLLITKALIGVLIEIPYDLIVYGVIPLLPLAINLLFPPVFIAVSALTLKLPTGANKRALEEYVESMLFTNERSRPLHIKTINPTRKSYAFNVLYVIMFIAAFYLVADRLVALQFNIVQGVIFFAFLSTASFLGYRLTLQVKEMEIVTTSQGVVSLIRDFLYAPFIFVGQRISYRFAKMNIVAQILDMAIELPLKTMLRLTRQWTVFLNNKKDELL